MGPPVPEEEEDEETEVDRLREALKPFACEYENWGDASDTDHPLINGVDDDADGAEPAAFTVGDLARAYRLVHDV